jgi:hypothetical protein
MKRRILIALAAAILAFTTGCACATSSQDATCQVER